MLLEPLSCAVHFLWVGNTEMLRWSETQVSGHHWGGCAEQSDREAAGSGHEETVPGRKDSDLSLREGD